MLQSLGSRESLWTNAVKETMVKLDMKQLHMLLVLPRQVFERKFSPRIPMYLQVITQVTVK